MTLASRQRRAPGAIDGTVDTTRKIGMSRGLGALQREILAALNEEHWYSQIIRTYDGRVIYDLLAVKNTLAQGKGRTDRLYVPELQAVYVWHTGAFTAAFSRAIRTLVSRGVLRPEHFPKRNGDYNLYHTHFISREPISVK
jgi:hypothetical protein